MHFRIEGLKLTFAKGPEEPQLSATPKLAMDLWPMWAGRALDHCAEARQASLKLKDSSGEQEHMVQEMLSSMEAAAAVGLSLDALYDSILQRVDIDDSTRRRWNQNGTPRRARLGAVIRRGFRISNSGGKQLDAFLKIAFERRNWVAHPSADFRKPERHPTLPLLVEWRFAAYVSDNVLPLVNALLQLLEQLPGLARDGNSDIVDWSKNLVPAAIELREKQLALGLTKAPAAPDRQRP